MPGPEEAERIQRTFNGYLLCEMVFEGDGLCRRPVSQMEVYSRVKAAIQQAHGDYGSAVLQASFHVKYFNLSTNIVIFRADRTFYKLLMSALAFITKIGKQNGHFQTLHVGGTIRSCHKFLVKYHRQQLPKMLALCQTQEEKTKIQDVIRRMDDRESFGLPPRTDAVPFNTEDGT